MSASDAGGPPADGEHDAPYRLEEQIGYALRKASQRHIAIFARHIPDLTPPQFAALARLAEIGEASQNQLGALVAMDAATIKGVIDRLRARGLVSLKRDEVDRRRLVVSLTKEGDHAVSKLVSSARRISRETTAPLSAEESETLMKLIGRLA